jgi:hypothetical protein
MPMILGKAKLSFQDKGERKLLVYVSGWEPVNIQSGAFWESTRVTAGTLEIEKMGI